MPINGIHGVYRATTPAEGEASTSALQLNSIGVAVIEPEVAAGEAEADGLEALVVYPAEPDGPAAGVASTSVLNLMDPTQPLPIHRGESRQVLDGAADGEWSRVVHSSGSARVGGKRHGMEVQISRSSGAGDIVVEVQGRADLNAPWAVLYELTCLAAASTAVVEEVPYMTEIRLVVTSAAAATVDGWVIA